MRTLLALIPVLVCPIGMCLVPMLLARRKRRGHSGVDTRETDAVEAENRARR